MGIAIPGAAIACAILALLPTEGRAEIDTNGARVLFIGNSYTRYNDMPRMVGEISRSVRGGPTLRTSRETHGGYDLRGHWRRRRVRNRIQHGRYSAVVIQGHSLGPIERPEEMAEYARRFSEHANAAGARLVLFQTWARREDSRVYERLTLNGPEDMLARVISLYGTLGRELRAQVAPVGDAFRRASSELPDTVLHRRDGTHPAVAGSYLSACVIYGTLTGRDPREARYRPWRLRPREAADIREIAAATLSTPR